MSLPQPQRRYSWQAQKDLVDQVETYRAKRPHLAYEHVCARLGIAWSRFAAARRDVAKGRPAEDIIEAPRVGRPRKVVDDPEPSGEPPRPQGRPPIYTLDDFHAVVNKVEGYARDRGVTLKSAMMRLGVSWTKFNYARRKIREAAREAIAG